MRLTSVLYKHRPMFIGVIPKFRGQALAGKHKFVPPATRGTRYMLWSDWKEQERVMKYAAAPYVTADQEIAYLNSIGQKHHDVDPLYTSHIETPMRQRYAHDIIRYFERSRKHEIWD